ncbi:alpha-glucosidase C-terminal domain-containing protein [Natronobacterium haloterrestre]|uniref:alpha-glucosidase C-terminal domain-containing protein n=1 Tax=Natronobacterium haloterrestre TaxID=148448 RepID=UPI001FE21596|nr:alpha-glucosidase C-terminal domain-containing protein [Halobiforma haloterrestris]
MFAYRRTLEDETLVVACNFSDGEPTVELPALAETEESPDLLLGTHGHGDEKGAGDDRSRERHSSCAPTRPACTNCSRSVRRESRRAAGARLLCVRRRASFITGGSHWMRVWPSAGIRSTNSSSPTGPRSRKSP